MKPEQGDIEPSNGDLIRLESINDENIHRDPTQIDVSLKIKETFLLWRVD